MEGGKELCDFLVVFDNIAIIWQIKNLKLHDDGTYKKTEVDKNIRQLLGARRTLFELNKSIELTNSRRGKEIFDPKSIKEVFLISALVGKGEEYFSFLEKYKKYAIHIFNRNFTQILLNELDTINDFIDYLRAKEIIAKTNKKIILSGGEEELLAFYLLNERSFIRFDDYNLVFIEEGTWELLQNKPEYKAKKEADKISYGWDEMINKAHETAINEYELIAREMARLDRFERRFCSKAFYEAQVRAHKDRLHNSFKRVFENNGVTYCFLFLDKIFPREIRTNLLLATCHVARGHFIQNQRVFGIATEKVLEPNCSYDFCLYDKPDWTNKDQEQMDEDQKILGILTNPEYQNVHEDEYPR